MGASGYLSLTPAPEEQPAMTLTPRVKAAIKTALAMTIAYGIALSMDWDRPY